MNKKGRHLKHRWSQTWQGWILTETAITWRLILSITPLFKATNVTSLHKSPHNHLGAALPILKYCFGNAVPAGPLHTHMQRTSYRVSRCVTKPWRERLRDLIQASISSQDLALYFGVRATFLSQQHGTEQCLCSQLTSSETSHRTRFWHAGKQRPWARPGTAEAPHGPTETKRVGCQYQVLATSSPTDH